MAQQHNQQFVPRAGASLPQLLAEAIERAGTGPVVSGILIVRQNDLVFWLPSGDTLQYHPGMAVHRIKVLADGGTDPLIEAMRLTAGDRVLDCTAGLCSDALVAAHVVGDTGVVHCCEASLPIALVVGHGISNYDTARKHIQPAMKRVCVQAVRAEHYLAQQASGSWDVVYFDPMFDDPVAQSAGIAPLRTVADHSPLNDEVLRSAARVARRAVVVKDRRHGRWFGDPRFNRVVGKSSRRVGYVVLDSEYLANFDANT